LHELIADRFVARAGAMPGMATDLATNRQVRLRVLPRDDEDREHAWTLRCDKLFRAQLASVNSLIDYGLVGVAHKFEAWSEARSAPLPRGARDPIAEVKEVTSHPAIAAVAETFRIEDARRGALVALWAPTALLVNIAILVLARIARLNGLVPVATSALEVHAALIGDRTLCLIDDGSSVLPGVRIVLAHPRPHICVGVGMGERSGLDCVSLDGPGDASYLRRHDRRSTRSERIAEQTATYVAERHAARTFAAGLLETTVAGPLSAEMSTDLIALRRRLEQSELLIASGRRAPAQRLLRQTIGGLARRQDWAEATRGALTLAAALMTRGRPRDTLRTLTDAARYAEQAKDAGALLDIALLAGHCWLDAARLDEAERVLSAALTSARGAGDRPREAALSIGLARCLFWRAEYAAAASCLQATADVGLSEAMSIRRLRMTARVAVARGDSAGALSAIDECRRRLPAGRTDLQADIEDTMAFVQLVVGNYEAVEHHVGHAVRAARQSRTPLRGLSATLLQVEAHRRRSRGLTESTSRALGRLAATASPILKARWELVLALGSGADAQSVTVRQIAVSRLKALELFSGVNHPPAAVGPDAIVGDVVGILQVCQQADDERTVLHDVCARVRQRLRAAGSAFIVPAARGFDTVATDGARIEHEIAERACGAGVTIAPARVRERIEAAAVVDYAGKNVGALCARWTIGTMEDLSRAAAVLSVAAVAAGPILAAFLARRDHAAPPTAVDFLGVTPRTVDLRHDIQRAAAAPFPILIQGESGSGKELVARAIHRSSPRRDRGFSTLNCAALPDDLVEAELFGHARGAFTGAIADRPGVFEDAHMGTLFLDEVGELSSRAQAKLLRVLQEGELRRVGENISRRVDVRVVAATNRDLRREADAGRFRTDLLYRLDVIHIAVPALRERPEDVAVLIDHFWTDATRRIGSCATLASQTRSALIQYAWPGNVRELQNVLASLAVRTPKRGIVPPSALPTYFLAKHNGDALRLDAARRTFEEGFIRAALVRTGGHRGRAADELGVSRQGLTKLMSRLGIR
jgi:transcriptional regulator with AAA-type ATPase domain